MPQVTDEAPEDVLVERVAEVLEEEFFDECAFDARNCAKAVLEALDITTLLERERRYAKALRQIEAAEVGPAGIARAFVALTFIARAALNPEGVLPD